MRRAHRRSHQIIWIVLTIVVTIGFTMALVKRKPQKKKAFHPAIETLGPATTVAGPTNVTGRATS